MLLLPCLVLTGWTAFVNNGIERESQELNFLLIVYLNSKVCDWFSDHPARRNLWLVGVGGVCIGGTIY